MTADGQEAFKGGADIFDALFLFLFLFNVFFRLPAVLFSLAIDFECYSSSQREILTL